MKITDEVAEWPVVSSAELLRGRLLVVRTEQGPHARR